MPSRACMKAWHTAAGEFQQLADRHDNFLYGECPLFAIALHRITGLPLYAFTGYDDDVESEVLVHAYVRLSPKLILDIKGPRKFETMLEDFEDDPGAEEGEEAAISVEELVELGLGDTCPPLDQALAVATELWAIVNRCNR